MMLRNLRVLRRFRAGLILLVVAVCFLVAAALTLPREHAVYFPNTLRAQVGASELVQGVIIEVSSSATDRYLVTATVATDAPSKARTDVSGIVSLVLPAGSRVLPPCDMPTCTFTADSYGTYVVGVIPKLHEIAKASSVAPNGEWMGVFTTFFRADHFAWDISGVALDCQLPIVGVEGPPGSAADPSWVNITYDLATAGYEWSGGPHPFLIQGGSVTWRETLNTASQSVSATANNPAALQRDSQLTFLAGALLGIAGGGFIGSLQEILHPDTAKDSAETISRRERDEPTPTDVSGLTDS